MMKIELKGLSFNNPLAFLALLGVLKILEDEREEWDPKVKWIDLKPHLYLSSNVNKEDVVKGILEGIKKYSNKMEFGELIKSYWHNKVDDFEKIKSKTGYEIHSALGTEGLLKDGKQIVKCTPLCMMFGSGNQWFLERLENAVSINKDDEERISKEISDSLFSSWVREKINKGEKMIAFRWDPEEYRSHAYRSMKPGGNDDPTLCVKGANRLAAVGFTMYKCIPTSKGIRTTSYNNEKEEMYWPIWNVKLSLTSILIIMRRSNTEKNDGSNIQDLNTYGIERIMAAKIFRDGKYKSTRYGVRVA